MVGGTKTLPKPLASIGEALSNMFGADSEDFVEILDVNEYQHEDIRENIRTIGGGFSEGKVILVDHQTVYAPKCNLNLDTPPKEESVIINEVAWMGGLKPQDLSHTDEWIELKNTLSINVDISGWQIKDAKGDIEIIFSQRTVISQGGFLLLERSNDGAVPGIIADLIYTGAIANEDETLALFNANCELVDKVVADPHWPSGDSVNRRTMERSEDLGWHTFSEALEEGILGTPKAPNSK